MSPTDSLAGPVKLSTDDTESNFKIPREAPHQISQFVFTVTTTAHKLADLVTQLVLLHTQQRHAATTSFDAKCWDLSINLNFIGAYAVQNFELTQNGPFQPISS